jgi:carbon-monoxide dehydrogenase medium subunit
MQVQGSKGKRAIPAGAFWLGFYTTALEPDELISGVSIPLPPQGVQMAYFKYRSRSSEDRPCVGVAAYTHFDGNTCTDLRIAVGAATDTPQRLAAVEESAQGSALTPGLIADIAEAYADGIDPLDDLRGSAWYRKEMIRVHVRRALERVSNGAR